MTYGVLGVGEIAEAMVTGLCEGVDDPPRMLLSPRNAGRAASLAKRFPSTSVAPDNQSLVDGCSTLVVSLRPADTRAVLDDLTFRPDHAIVSVMAGVSLDELASLVAPARELSRAIPLPPVARRTGATPIHPDAPAARALFERLGGASAVGDVAAFEAMSAATATIAAHVRYLAAISGWLSEHGVAPDQASRYVSSIFAGLAETLSDGTGDLEAVARAHATPGGINERFAATLDEAGVFELVARSLQTVYDSLRASRHSTKQ
jgi:pyrroline-5-carboxylate reductase